MQKRKVITTLIAAQLLGFSQSYIRRLCIQGNIDAQKLGHDWIINEKCLKNIKRKRKENKPKEQ